MAKVIQIKKVRVFDKATCNVIGNAFEKVVSDFAAQYGLTAKRGGGMFDANSFSPKVTFCIPVVDEQSGREVNKKDMVTFKQLAPLYDIDPEAFGKELVIRGRKFTIVGFNARASKAPINIVDEKGLTFKCGLDVAIRQYPLKPADAASVQPSPFANGVSATPIIKPEPKLTANQKRFVADCKALKLEIDYNHPNYVKGINAVCPAVHVARKSQVVSDSMYKTEVVVNDKVKMYVMYAPK